MTRTIRLAIGSLVVGIVVLGLKALAWRLTGSVALLSDALESTVNVATALVALVAIHFAARPADEGHPYGHHKAEFFSAVLEGVMIIVAAVLILEEAWKGFQAPRALDTPFVGLAVNGAASALNGFWCWMLIREGRRLRSPALVADGHHLLTDVVSSAGVAVGVLLAVVTGWYMLDPLLAGLVAVNILWSGWKVVTASLSGLLDEAVPPEVLAAIRKAIAGGAGGALEVHDLRTRHAGRMIFIDFHLVVPGHITVAAAHDICDRIEEALLAELTDVRITIHVEPDGEAKHSGVVIV